MYLDLGYHRELLDQQSLDLHFLDLHSLDLHCLDLKVLDLRYFVLYHCSVLYFDQYYFPFNRFQASFPSRGWEFFTQLDYKPKRGTLLYLRFRSDNRQTNADEIPEGPALVGLVRSGAGFWLKVWRLGV